MTKEEVGVMSDISATLVRREIFEEPVTVLADKKILMVEWCEPWHYHDVNEAPHTKYINRVIRVTAEDAIIYQKAYVALENKVSNRTFEYKSDKEALDDFVIMNWGKLIEVEG